MGHTDTDIQTVQDANDRLHAPYRLTVQGANARLHAPYALTPQGANARLHASALRNA